MSNRTITVIAHNIRSTYNLGSILRTADGFGVHEVICTGYTPYPAIAGDSRLPHLRDKITAQIHKTALGAEATVPVSHADDIHSMLAELKQNGVQVVALEQSPKATMLPDFMPAAQHIALVLGEEVHGTPQIILDMCDTTVEIPMFGHKESFNVSVAAGIALYQLRTK